MSISDHGSGGLPAIGGNPLNLSRSSYLSYRIVTQKLGITKPNVTLSLIQPAAQERHGDPIPLTIHLWNLWGEERVNQNQVFLFLQHRWKLAATSWLHNSKWIPFTSGPLHLSLIWFMNGRIELLPRVTNRKEARHSTLVSLSWDMVSSVGEDCTLAWHTGKLDQSLPRSVSIGFLWARWDWPWLIRLVKRENSHDDERTTDSSTWPDVDVRTWPNGSTGLRVQMWALAFLSIIRSHSIHLHTDLPYKERAKQLRAQPACNKLLIEPCREWLNTRRLGYIPFSFKPGFQTMRLVTILFQ